MNTKGKELFKERAKDYFGEDSNRFLELLNNKASSALFLNEKKANKDEILSLVDFSYKASSLTDKSFYCLDEAIGKTKAYELGLIYPQDIESSLPALCVKTNDVKLGIDLCAAPGGKTINVLNRLSNDTLLISNDISYKRASILASNLERLGLDNTVVTSLEPEYLANRFENCFDLVILDAPCSGEGMIRKYPEILNDYCLGNILKLAETQTELLENAYKLLAPFGQLLYSTCTYAFEEDENQIESFLDRHKDVSLVSIDVPTKNYSKLNGAVKLSPLNETEGQFFCLMVKNGGERNRIKSAKETTNKEVERFVNDNLNINEYHLYRDENRFYMSLFPLIDIDKNVLNKGIYLGELKKDRFEPSHSLYRANSLKNKYRYVYDLKDHEYNQYISGNSLKTDLKDAYYLISYKDQSLGFAKISKGVLKNKYPKGLRRMV